MKIDRVNNIYEKYMDHNTKVKEEENRSKNMYKDNIVNIQISDTAKALVDTISQSKDTSFSERVEKIRQSIISGKYKVSSEEIAEKIMKVLESQEGSDIK